MPFVPERLKGLRKIKHLTQKDVAAALGIDERNYRSYENGETDPITANAVRIADYFDVSLDYLLGRSDTPQRL